MIRLLGRAKRRTRVLRIDADEQQDSARLVDPRFASAVLITTYNAAAFYFGQQRALNFAKHSNAASFWIQATDAPPMWYAKDFSPELLREQKRKWLAYHSKKTGNILSLLLACVDMPYRVTHSHGTQFKEYGIHNGAKCILKGWELTERDLARVQCAEDSNIVLLDLPKILFVQMLTPMKKQY